MYKQLKHKFNAVTTELDGIKFPSKKHARHYEGLKLQQRAGEVLFFLREVPFHLTGGVTYRVDFMVFRSDGNVTLEEVKGVKTPLYILKKKQVEALYPVQITEF